MQLLRLRVSWEVERAQAARQTLQPRILPVLEQEAWRSLLQQLQWFLLLEEMPQLLQSYMVLQLLDLA